MDDQWSKWAYELITMDNCEFSVSVKRLTEFQMKKLLYSRFIMNTFFTNNKYRKFHLCFFFLVYIVYYVIVVIQKPNRCVSLNFASLTPLSYFQNLMIYATVPIANFHFATPSEREQNTKKGWTVEFCSHLRHRCEFYKVLFTRFNLNSKLAGVSVS